MAASNDAALAELTAMLEGLSGGSHGERGEVQKLLMSVLEEAIDQKENRLDALQTKAQGQYLVVKDKCPYNMRGVDELVLADFMNKGKLQGPPFTQIWVKSEKTGDLKACVPMQVDVRRGASASSATAAAVGKMIISQLAEDPEAKISVECDAWSSSRKLCDTESPASCSWYSNGCYTHEFIAKQQADALEIAEKALRELPAASSAAGAKNSARRTELEARVAALTAAKAKADKAVHDAKTPAAKK